MSPAKTGRSLTILFRECTQYGVPLWQCPQFLFLVMGWLIIISMLIVYGFGAQFVEDPYLIALIVLAVAASLLIIAYVITRSFERLAEANRLKSEFVSIVSHQLRAPLSNLTWAVEFLMSGRAGRVGEAQTSYFQILKENSYRMRELVNDLLSVSRIEQGELPFERAEFSFGKLVDGIVEDFRPLVRASNIELEVEGDENLPFVRSDPKKISQVISNLLDNAIRYAWSDEELKDREGAEKKIFIRFGKKGDSIYFEVEDTGVGIPKRDQKFIFQKFFRSSSVQQHETHGSGLGLYIAKSIIGKGGGTIGFTSVEGKGSKFWFTIPLS